MRGPERRSTVEEHSSGTLGESEECRMRYSLHGHSYGQDIDTPCAPLMMLATMVKKLGIFLSTIFE